MKVLVVEDEYVVAKDVQDSLSSLGYAVPALASSGEDAIQKAEETRPDLVLMDIKLAGDMDGVEAADEIWHRFNIPVVYLTGNSDRSTLQRAKVTEPFGYVLKPFEDEELHAAIEMAFYRHKSESQREVARSERVEEDVRKSDERFRKLFYYSSDAIFLIDPTRDKILDANPRACDMLGYSYEELLSLGISAVYSSKMPELMSFAQSVYERGYGWSDQLECTGKTGQVVRTDMSATMFDIGGKSCVLAMIREITGDSPGSRLPRKGGGWPNAAAGVQLTRRELEVLRLLASGERNKEIAGHLSLSVNTVKFHIENIFQKLGVQTRTQAARAAAECGLVDS